MSFGLRLEMNAPTKMLRMEMMTQARETGAKNDTNFTPNPTTNVMARRNTVP